MGGPRALALLPFHQGCGLLMRRVSSAPACVTESLCMLAFEDHFCRQPESPKHPLFCRITHLPGANRGAGTVCREMIPCIGRNPGPGRPLSESFPVPDGNFRSLQVNNLFQNLPEFI